jgi:hypothetical protein
MSDVYAPMSDDESSNPYFDESSNPCFAESFNAFTAESFPVSVNPYAPAGEENLDVDPFADCASNVDPYALIPEEVPAVRAYTAKASTSPAKAGKSPAKAGKVRAPAGKKIKTAKEIARTEHKRVTAAARRELLSFKRTRHINASFKHFGIRGVSGNTQTVAKYVKMHSEQILGRAMFQSEKAIINELSDNMRLSILSNWNAIEIHTRTKSQIIEHLIPVMIPTLATAIVCDDSPQFKLQMGLVKAAAKAVKLDKVATEKHALEFPDQDPDDHEAICDLNRRRLANLLYDTYSIFHTADNTLSVNDFWNATRDINESFNPAIRATDEGYELVVQNFEDSKTHIIASRLMQFNQLLTTGKYKPVSQLRSSVIDEGVRLFNLDEYTFAKSPESFDAFIDFYQAFHEDFISSVESDILWSTRCSVSGLPEPVVKLYKCDVEHCPCCTGDLFHKYLRHNFVLPQIFFDYCVFCTMVREANDPTEDGKAYIIALYRYVATRSTADDIDLYGPQGTAADYQEDRDEEIELINTPSTLASELTQAQRDAWIDDEPLQGHPTTNAQRDSDNYTIQEQLRMMRLPRHA